MSWIEIGPLLDIPRLGARVVRTAQGDIAVFRAADDSVFALDDRCPHKGGPLSQGIVYDRRVACPLHNWVISLESGEATGADKGCTRRHEVRVEDGRVLLRLSAAPHSIEPALEQRCAAAW
jgi:nitrite reductase (NADH) small subunit